MFGFFRRKPAGRSAPAKTEWQRLRDQFADPMLEHATTKQALVVSAASVLDRIWLANGGSNWDASCEDDYLAPLYEHLATESVFTPAYVVRIRAALDAIRDTGRRNLAAIAEAEAESENSEQPEEDDWGNSVALDSANEHVEFIVRQVIEYCHRFPEPLPLRDEEEYRGHF